jgi:hypothetical protein
MFMPKTLFQVIPTEIEPVDRGLEATKSTPETLHLESQTRGATFC